MIEMAKAVNEKFFDTWTEESAYILGFAFADGSMGIVQDKYYSFGLVNTDLEIMRQMGTAMQSEFPMYERQRTPNAKVCYNMSISNPYLCRRLVELGLRPNKTKQGVFPEVPDEYLRHFIRGYFDGNGHFTYEIHKKTQRRMVSGFTTGNQIFCEGISESLHKLGLRKAVVHYRQRFRETGLITGETSSYGVRYYENDTKKLYDLMYEGTTIFMKRKKDYYDNIISRGDIDEEV